MNTFTNLHTADWHLYEPNIEQTKPAIEFLTNEVHRIKPHSVTIAGDLGVKRGIITATESKIIRTNIYSMAEVCPIFITVGNHGMPNHYDKIDTVQGILCWDKDGESISHPNIHIGSTYRHIDIELNGIMVRIYFLPHPSKYIYLTKNRDIAPTKINAKMTQAMQNLLLGIEQDRLDCKLPSVLVGHGTIKGGLADSEMVMTTENDLAVDKDWLPRCNAVQYGHLHIGQVVGRGVYCGATAPLIFTKNEFKPSYCLWEIPEDPDSAGTYERIPIPVAHQLITLDIKAEQFNDETPPTQIIKQAIDKSTVKDSKIRVRVTIDDKLRSLIDQAEIRRYLDKLGAFEHKLVIESEATVKIRLADIDSKMEAKKLLTAWSELDPDRKDYLKEILELHSAIVNNVPASELSRLTGIDYEIVSISGKNYKPLIDIELIFANLGGIICITGENHIGKSQIATLERFVFWKILRRGTLLSDVVRIGTMNTTVSITFKARGGLYNVTRMVALDKKMNANSILNFTKNVNGEWLPVNEGTSIQTQVELEKYVGTYSMYASTRFGSQSDIDLLCKMTPAEMKDTVQEAMNYESYGIYKQYCEDLLDEIEKKFTVAFGRIEELKQELTGEQAQVELKATIEKEIKDFTDSIETLTKDLQMITDEIAKYEADLEKKKTLESEQTTLNHSKVEYETSINSESIILEAKPKAEEGIKIRDLAKIGINKLTEEKKEFDQAILEFKDEENKLDAEVNTNQKHISENKQEISSITENIGFAKRNWERVITDFETEIGRYKTTGALVKKVPCVGMDLQSNCELLMDANDANEKAKELRKQLDAHLITPKYDTQLDTDLTNTESGLAQDVITEGKLNEQMNELVKKRENSDAVKKSGEIQMVLMRQTKIFNDEDEMGHDVILQRANLAEGKIKTFKSEIEKIETKLDGISALITALPLGLGDATKRQEKKSVLWYDLKQAKDSRDGRVKGLGTVERRLEEFKEKSIQLADFEKISETGVRQIKVHKLYREAMSRDGIPYLLLEKALPQFEKYTNEFLCADEGFPNSLRVQVKATKDTQSGKTKDEVVISFIDDRGIHPLGDASGFQKVAIGYALRASMAKLQANATGAIIKHCIFDEGWGVFDQPNLLLGKRIIQKLGEEFGQFFYITHNLTLQEVADTTIRVFAVDGGADIEIS